MENISSGSGFRKENAELLLFLERNLCVEDVKHITQLLTSSDIVPLEEVSTLLHDTSLESGVQHLLTCLNCIWSNRRPDFSKVLDMLREDYNFIALRIETDFNQQGRQNLQGHHGKGEMKTIYM